jgi:hypothetical protein
MACGVVPSLASNPDKSPVSGILLVDSHILEVDIHCSLVVGSLPVVDMLAVDILVAGSPAGILLVAGTLAAVDIRYYSRMRLGGLGLDIPTW